MLKEAYIKKYGDKYIEDGFTFREAYNLVANDWYAMQRKPPL